MCRCRCCRARSRCRCRFCKFCRSRKVSDVVTLEGVGGKEGIGPNNDR